MSLRKENLKITGKLAVIALGMFAFGYALVPIYRAICEVTGINILALSERQVPGMGPKLPANTQVDTTRKITIEFDTNVRGPWDFKPLVRSMEVHPAMTDRFTLSGPWACTAVRRPSFFASPHAAFICSCDIVGAPPLRMLCDAKILITSAPSAARFRTASRI